MKRRKNSRGIQSREPVDRSGEPARNREGRDDEGDRLGGERERIVELPTTAAPEGEDEGDGDVLDDEDGEHETGLVVGQPARSMKPMTATAEEET